MINRRGKSGEKLSTSATTSAGSAAALRTVASSQDATDAADTTAPSGARAAARRRLQSVSQQWVKGADAGSLEQTSFPRREGYMRKRSGAASRLLLRYFRLEGGWLSYAESPAGLGAGADSGGELGRVNLRGALVSPPEKVTLVLILVMLLALAPVLVLMLVLLPLLLMLLPVLTRSPPEKVTAKSGGSGSEFSITVRTCPPVLLCRACVPAACASCGYTLLKDPCCEFLL